VLRETPILNVHFPGAKRNRTHAGFVAPADVGESRWNLHARNEAARDEQTDVVRII